MSVHVNDFAAGVAVFAALPPRTLTAAYTGAAVDLISADGPCFAVQQVGTFEEGNTWTGASNSRPTAAPGGRPSPAPPSPR